MLSEIPVTSQGEWNKITLQLPVTGNIRLAFEGSPSKGAIVFLDDLLINERQNKSGIIPSYSNRPYITTFFSFMGVRQNNIRKGINIVKKSDGTVIKIMSK